MGQTLRIMSCFKNQTIKTAPAASGAQPTDPRAAPPTPVVQAAKGQTVETAPAPTRPSANVKAKKVKHSFPTTLRNQGTPKKHRHRSHGYTSGHTPVATGYAGGFFGAGDGGGWGGGACGGDGGGGGGGGGGGC